MGRHGVASPVECKVTAQNDQTSSGKIVAVGDGDEWKKQGHSLPATEDISFVAFHELDEATLAICQPEVIYSPVLARNFDCIEMATLLQNIGFSGTYRAVGHGLPRPGLIEREVRQIARRLKFELLQF